MIADALGPSGQIVSKTVNCPVCEDSAFHSFKFGLVQCKTCGVVLSVDIWKEQANEKMEEVWFGVGYQTRESFWVRLFEARNNRRTLDRLAQHKVLGRRLLEIGVGSGSFLSAARAVGFEVKGCDLSASICDRVRRVHGIEMYGEALSTLTGEGCFDVVVMNHVLEHVQQPIEFLRDVRRLLAPGGVVHVAVPNVACWEASLSGWTSYEPYHLAYFDLRTLARTVSASGLEIQCVTTFESFSGWFLVLLRTVLGLIGSRAVEPPDSSKAGYFGVRRSGMVENAYRLTMVCVGAVLWPLRFVQAKLGSGDEAVCLARKPSRASVE